MKQALLLLLCTLPLTTACKKGKAGDSNASEKPTEAKAAVPEAPIELTEVVDLGAAITDPDDTSLKGIKAKTPKGATTEAGLTGALIRIGERSAYEISKAYEPGAHVPKARKEAESDTLDKVVKFHVDKPDAILWETKSELGGENNFHFAAEVKVGDASYKCFNTGYGNFTRTQAEALLASCQSLTN